VLTDVASVEVRMGYQTCVFFLLLTLFTAALASSIVIDAPLPDAGSRMRRSVAALRPGTRAPYLVSLVLTDPDAFATISKYVFRSAGLQDGAEVQGALLLVRITIVPVSAIPLPGLSAQGRPSGFGITR